MADCGCSARPTRWADYIDAGINHAQAALAAQGPIDLMKQVELGSHCGGRPLPALSRASTSASAASQSSTSLPGAKPRRSARR